MTDNPDDEYLTLLNEIQATLQELRSLGSSANLTDLCRKVERVNTLAEERGEYAPYPESLVTEIENMQKRLSYYHKTGFDSPSLSDGKF